MLRTYFDDTGKEIVDASFFGKLPEIVSQMQVQEYADGSVYVLYTAQKVINEKKMIKLKYTGELDTSFKTIETIKPNGGGSYYTYGNGNETAYGLFTYDKKFF